MKLERLFVILLALVLVLALPVTASAEEVASGTCGENLTWVLDDAGTLTISGTGAMADYATASEAPWYSQRESIKGVVVENGVTGIGARAFYNCTNALSVTIGENVTVIGTYAFRGCALLERVTIPANVTQIDGSAFRACSLLADVTFEGNAPTLGDYAFTDCAAGLTIHYYENGTGFDASPWTDYAVVTMHVGEWTIIVAPTCTTDGQGTIDCAVCGPVTDTIPATGHTYVDGVCSVCQNTGILESGSCGQQVTYVLYANGHLKISGSGRMDNYDYDREYYSPWSDELEQIKSVTIGRGVTNVGSCAFQYCRNLTSITIPEGVTYIGTWAFSECEKLSSVYIPATVNSIEWYAFYDCKSLTDITIPEGVTSIGVQTFYRCISLASITIPGSVTNISSSAFEACSSLTGIWVDGENKTYSSDSYGVLFDKEQTMLIQAPAMGLFGEYEIPDSVTSIGSYAFSDCSSLESITIPDSVTSIGSYAFSGCSGLESITIPDSVTAIDVYAFRDCSGLTGITIPESLTCIPAGAFMDCSSLTNITIPESVTSIGNRAFEGCSSLASITIPDSVTNIGSYVFYDCSSMTNITIPESVTSIGNGVFGGYSSLALVHYTGTEAQWEAVIIGDYNDRLIQATRHYEVALGQFEDEPVYVCQNCGYFYPDGTKVPWQQIGNTIVVKIGDTVVIKEETGNYADLLDDSELDKSIADVTVKGVTTDGDKELSAKLNGSTLEDGTYIFANDRAGKPMTNRAASAGAASGSMAGMSLQGNVDEMADNAIWNVTKVSDGVYTVQDASGKYLSIGDNVAELVDDPCNINITYTNGYWTLSVDQAYLNDAGGHGTTAAGWDSTGESWDAATDYGSQWSIYKVNVIMAENSTTITIDGESAGETMFYIGTKKFNICVCDPLAVALEVGESIEFVNNYQSELNTVNSEGFDSEVVDVEVETTVTEEDGRQIYSHKIAFEALKPGDCEIRVGTTIYVIHVHSFNQQNTEDSYKATNATCTEAATYYYSCACGAVGTEVFVSGSSLGHDYGTPEFIWGDDNTATATATCANDTSHVLTLDATVTSQATSGDCQNAAYTVYTATVTIGEATFADAKTVNGELGEHNWIDATCTDPKTCDLCGATDGERLGHAYGEPAIVWNEDNTASATVTCANDKTHVLELEVKVTREIKDGDCETASVTTYTATVEYNAKTYTDTKTVTGEIPGHTPAEAVRENKVEATCDKAGSYDEVVYCSVCEEEISRVTKTIDKLAHTPGEAVRENEVKATCTAEGSYDEVVYCSVCDEELSRVTKTVEKLAHTPAEAVRENEVKATCTAEGGYDEVVYCSVCEEEISRVTRTIEKLAHTPAEAVRENEKAATCDKAGSYDEVVYCSVCEEEISRKTVTVDALGHKDADKNHKCDLCGAELSKCIDENKDYKCDICGAELEKPEDPEDPSEPVEEDDVIRLAGANRWETSLKVADEMKANLGVEKFGAIIIASGNDFADALAGSYLSTVKNAPILLGWGKGGKYVTLDEANIAYIKANLAEGGTVYILGGKNAVPELYETELAGYNVKRLGGANRFETNLLILAEAGVNEGDEILVCTSTNFADSLSASATAKPILLVFNEYGKLYGKQPEFLSNMKNCTFTVIGGESAVSADLAKAIEAYGKVERLAGANRFETSVLVAQKYFKDVDTAVLAYAWNYPDGLCGGSLAYSLKAPLILTMSKYEAKAVEYMTDTGIEVGLVLGGDSLISDEAVRSIFAMEKADGIIVK